MASATAPKRRCEMSFILIAVLGIIVVSYVVGSLSSSIETEQMLPHRY